MNQHSNRLARSDWEKLTKLSTKIADAAIVECDEPVAEKYIEDLLVLIESLLQQYGKLPSLLATKADFIHDDQMKVSLYEEAYTIAEKSDDFINMRMILDSISEM